MPDAITPEERKMIDAALERGEKVKRIPPGVSSYVMQWDEEKKGLRYVDPEQAKAAFSTNWAGGGRRKRSTNPEVAARRMKVADMMDTGKTAPEIARLLKVSLPTVYADAKRLGKTFSDTGPRTKSVNPASKRQQVKAAFSPDRTVREIAEDVGLPDKLVRNYLRSLGLKAARASRGHMARPGKAAQIEARRARVRDMVAQGMNQSEIAEKVGITQTTISQDCKALGIKPVRKRRKNTGEDRAGKVKAAQAEKRLRKVRDRRRFKTGVPATGEIKTLADADATGTIYPHTVKQPSAGETVLKDGKHNTKIGGDVLVGWLKGAPIYTLTLEERATCPRSCPLWRGCYGNLLNRSQRFAHGSALMFQIEQQLAEIAETHARFLVRLHVLGDFWSIEYVSFWRRMLFKHPGLHVFGFTAWGPETKIGSHITALRGALPERVWLRHSGRCGPWGSFTIDFPTERKTIGDAVVCPAQLDANEGSPRRVHCGNCAACWSTDRAITFVEH